MYVCGQRRALAESVSHRQRHVKLAKLHGNQIHITTMKVFFLALFAAFAFATSFPEVDAQLPPGSIMTFGTASSHSVSMPVSLMPRCPGGPLGLARFST